MRKLIAIIFTAILVFPLLLATQAIISVGSFTLDRQFYIDTLDNESVYENIITDTMVPRILNSGLYLPVGANTSQIQDVLESILDREYFKSQVGDFMDNLFGYVQGRQDEFTPVIDLTPLKTSLLGEKQQEFLTALATAMPVCEPGQTPGFGGAGQSACKPEGIPDELLVESYLKPILPLAIAQIPDQLPLVENWEELESYRNYRSYIPGMAVPASLLLSAILLAILSLSLWYLTAVIADETWRVRLQWLGWTLMIPSGLIFLIGLATLSNIPTFWANYGLDRAQFSANPLFGPALRETLREIIRGAVPRVSSAFLMIGGISGAIALGLIFWGLMTPKQNPD
ncbi:MAG: hypothetical protein FJZ98_09935 [Chloroflexi bacterium]|nr:hypothetical protein [Chloroflexota bacterium]